MFGPRRRLLVQLNLTSDGHELLDEGNNYDEGSSNVSPATAESRPDPKARDVKNVQGEHGSGPNADEENGEKEASYVGCVLGSAELLDDEVQRRSVVKLVTFFQVQLALKRGG